METFREATLCFRTYKNFELKVKLSWIGIRERKESAFVQRLSCPKEIFLTFVFYLNVWCIEKNSRMYILFHIKKQHYFVHFLCLFLKLSIAFCVSLTFSWRRPLSYRHQSIDLRTKSMDWFLYDNDLPHERVKHIMYFTTFSNIKWHFCHVNEIDIRKALTCALLTKKDELVFTNFYLIYWWQGFKNKNEEKKF